MARAPYHGSSKSFPRISWRYVALSNGPEVCGHTSAATLACADAPVPPPPVNVMLGGFCRSYFEPRRPMVMEVTTPLVTLAVAVAVVPPAAGAPTVTPGVPV